jgi:hypothetical protein
LCGEKNTRAEESACKLTETADLSTALRFGRDDKFVATLIANYLANLSSRPKRSAVERSAVFWTIRASAPWFSHTLFSPATAWIRKKYDFFSKLFKPLKDRIFPSKRIFPPPL